MLSLSLDYRERLRDKATDYGLDLGKEYYAWLAVLVLKLHVERGISVTIR